MEELKHRFSNTWSRCKSLTSTMSSSTSSSLTRSRTWHSTTPSKCQVAPAGCFTVCVGAQKQKFVVKTEYLNHPLLKMLLEDAEMEYGFDIQGPILLPCDVDLFCKVLAEMESGIDGDDEVEFHRKGFSPLILCSPARRSRRTVKDGYGGGDYRILSPSKLFKLNSL